MIIWTNKDLSLHNIFLPINRRKRLKYQNQQIHAFLLNEDVNICWQGCRSRTLKYSNGGVSATMLHGHQSSSGSARLRRHFTELHLNGAPAPVPPIIRGTEIGNSWLSSSRRCQNWHHSLSQRMCDGQLGKWQREKVGGDGGGRLVGLPWSTT